MMRDQTAQAREGGPVILVTGATGNQGGAVIDALLSTPSPWRVRALTRTPDGASAQALRARGVQIAGGDMADADSLRPALHGVYGVFSVQNSRTAGLKGEVAQGLTLADAAMASGVEHFVYTSVGGAERVRGIPHFDTKWQIEQHLRGTGLPTTVLRPTAFMNVFTARGATIGLGMMAAALGSDQTLQMIAVPDIGTFARIAFDQPQRFAGRALEIAGDELTIPQIATALRDAGRPSRYRRLPKPLLRLMGKESRMILWFGESGYQASISALRIMHPSLLTLHEWLAQSAAAAQRPSNTDS
jgi:uncharacterized protein YbjT (DUF2867 family)